MSKKVASLILAAGASTRMEKEIKQLLPWGRTTLLGHTIEQARAVLEDCNVVLGAHAEKIRETIPKEIDIIYNPDWQLGIGSSIASGVRSMIQKASDLEAVLILLIDQPLLNASYFKEMVKAFASGNYNIVATAYGDKVGVPAIFHKSLFDELCTLNQDFGAKQIIRENIDKTLVLQPKGREIDIDTLSDYNQLSGNK